MKRTGRIFVGIMYTLMVIVLVAGSWEERGWAEKICLVGMGQGLGIASWTFAMGLFRRGKKIP